MKRGVAESAEEIREQEVCVLSVSLVNSPSSTFQNAKITPTTIKTNPVPKPPGDHLIPSVAAAILSGVGVIWYRNTKDGAKNAG